MFGTKVKRDYDAWEFTAFVGVVVNIELVFRKRSLDKAIFGINPRTELELKTRGPVKVLKDKELGVIRLGSFMLGPLPGAVLLVPTLSVSSNIEAGLTFGVSSVLWFKYDGGVWQTSIQSKPWQELQSKVALDIKAEFAPRIEVLLFNSAGPFFAPVLGAAVEAEVKARSPGCEPAVQTCFTPKVTLGGKYGSIVPEGWAGELKRDVDFVSIDLTPWCLPESTMCLDAGPNASDAGSGDAHFAGNSDAGGGLATSGDAGARHEECLQDPDLCGNLGAPIAPECGDCEGPRARIGAMKTDPHLRTFDGLYYEMQAVGEFVLTRSEGGELEVQVRTRPVEMSDRLSVNSAVAARVGQQVISIVQGRESPLWIDRKPQPLGPGTHALQNGASVYVTGSSWKVVWPDGSLLWVHRRPNFLNVEVGVTPARKKTMLGLLGDYDDRTQSELRRRDGSLLDEQPSARAFYGDFVSGWRVSQEESLFDYGPSESTATFTDVAFPRVVVDHSRPHARAT